MEKKAVFVLPTGLDNTRPNPFIRLPHPRTGLPSLYLTSSRASTNEAPTPPPSTPFSEEAARDDGLLEVQVVAPVNDKQRSWFLIDGDAPSQSEEVSKSGPNGHVISDGKMHILTPVDPLFLVISLFNAISRTNLFSPPEPSSTNAETNRYLPYLDIFEEASSLWRLNDAKVTTTRDGDGPRQKRRKLEGDGETDDVEEQEEVSLGGVGEDAIRLGEMNCVKRAVERISDIQEISPTLKTYRPSRSKILEILRNKVKILARPENIKKCPSLVRGLAKDGLDEEEAVVEKVQNTSDQGQGGTGAEGGTEPLPAQNTAPGTEDGSEGPSINAQPSQDTTETMSTTPSSSRPTPEIRALARELAALEILNGYLSIDVAAALKATFDFAPLESYLVSVRGSACLAADHSAPPLDTASSKAKSANDPKKRKAPVKGSRGVEILKKVNTKGMKNIASFFTKKEV